MANKDNTYITWDYYQVELHGFEDEPEVIIASSLSDAKSVIDDKYGKGFIKSIEKITAADFSQMTDDYASANHIKNMYELGGGINEARSLKTFIGRHLTNRKNYQAANKEVKKGMSVSKAAHMHKGVDTKELQSMSEETLHESLKPSDPIDNYIRDFQQSDAPQFKGKSKEKRRQMAIAAKLNAESKGASSDAEEKFHQELDKLVHKTFGPSDDEKKAEKNMKECSSPFKKKIKSMKESSADINESQFDPDKIFYLARIGLVDRNEVLLLRRALDLKKQGAPLSLKHRDILFKLMDRLLSLILGHPHMFNLAKRQIMREAFEEFEDSSITEYWNNIDKYLENIEE